MVRIRKHHFRSLAVLWAVGVLFVIGSTLAFFSSTDEATNRFVGNGFDILLTETRWNPSAAQNLLPGDEVDKNPRITNNDRNPGYVFLRVTVPADVIRVDQDDGKPLSTTAQNVPMYPMYKFMVWNGTSYVANGEFSAEQKVHSHWKLLSATLQKDAAGKNPVYVYVYAYAQTDDSALIPLNEGETTVEPLFDRLQLWNFAEGFDPAQSHSVRVEALGIQSNLPGYTASDFNGIWALVNGGGGG